MSKLKLDQEQMSAIETLQTGSILCGGVGSGKSLTSLGYWFKYHCGGLISTDGTIIYRTPSQIKKLVIITTAMKRDNMEWQEEMLSFPIVSEDWVTVDSWNNIGKYVNHKNTLFILDEQRLVGYGAWAKAFFKIANNNPWILLTATPGDTWMDYMTVFIANGFYKNKTDFTTQHVMYKRFSKFPIIQNYVNTHKLEKYRNQILVDMIVERHTTRHYHLHQTEYDKELYDATEKNLWNPYTDEPFNTKSELLHVLRKISNSDISKIETLKTLMDDNPRMIVFYNFNYELEKLKEYAETNDIPYAEHNGKKHESIPNTDRWIYLVQYMSGAEGWNCVSTNTIAFYSLNYSYRLFEQASGRIDRRNTEYTDLHYHVLRSNSKLDKKIHNAIKKKKNFNARSY